MQDSFSEIIDAFGRLSDIAQKNDEIRKLRVQNKEINSTCGSCIHWMSCICPLETPKNKISMGHPICQKFEIKPWHQDLVNKNELRITELLER